MKSIVKLECYIEEYDNGLCARLRDKKSNKKVCLIGKNANKSHLLRFLSQAKINQYVMPTIYDKNGFDIVAVRGYVCSEDNNEIIINIDTETGGYLFE